jgi:hypothetical protein
VRRLSKGATWPTLGAILCPRADQYASGADFREKHSEIWPIKGPRWLRGPTLGANEQRMVAAGAKPRSHRGIEARNSKAPRRCASEACVKRVGAVFSRAQEMAPRSTRI